ncbi:MAG: CDP-diacylglycerol--glycerol-3-phosphate 3-phosphatidyltransferase [Pseudomonadota bacterium]|nr:CDP-diacylglycerol--glycerol-3-phosphate 3-phosphatidyltransferase [Pseudomonadota bacterium]
MVNLANSLTITRIALVPLIVVLFYLPLNYSNHLIMTFFLIAVATDWLDGIVARKYGQISSFGAFLDPVADKLLVCVILIVLLQKNPSVILMFPVTIIISREIGVSALREWMAKSGKSTIVAVSFKGKVKTFLQMTALALLIVGSGNTQSYHFLFGLILLYVATILTLWSLCDYIKKAFG